jgi:hypothetical protein
LFSDTPRPVNVKQRVQHKTHERRHTLAGVGASARRLVVCSARSERVKKTGGLGVEPQEGCARQAAWVQHTLGARSDG